MIFDWLAFKVSGNYWYWHNEFATKGWFKRYLRGK